ncbi:MAG: hypothetical protein ACAH59_10460 [Pseudobdellovibrionaceae bacterium]
MNQKGASILQSLVVICIMALISMGIMSMISNGLKGQKTIAQNTDFDVLKNDLKWIFTNDDLCKAAFRDNANNPARFTGGTSNIDNIFFDTNNTILAKKGEKYGNGLTITDIRLVYDKDETNADIPPVFNALTNRTLHWVKLVITADREYAYGGGMSSERSAHSFAVFTNVTNRIDGCMVPGSDAVGDKKNFIWIDATKACASILPTGQYIDAQLIDDADAGHDLNENSTLNGKELRLCASGFLNANDIRWVDNACPAGYRDVGVVDDNDSEHRLNESHDDGTPYKHWCMRGLSTHKWTGTCEAGWSPVYVSDDAETDDGHWMWEGSDGAGGFQLCVK